MSKTIYLIRHGESEVNRNKNHVKESNGHNSMFKKSYWKSLKNCITLSMDSDLTDVGKQQAVKQGAMLKSVDFLKDKSVECILHSPLKRAKDTCYLMFEEWAGIPLIEEPMLVEKNMSEYLYSDIRDRGFDLKNNLMNRKEKCILLVGHSRIFQAMVNREFKIPNGSVWKVKLSQDGVFYNLSEIYEQMQKVES